MSQADELNVEDESTQSGAFPVCQTGWIKNGCEQSLAIKELQITDNHLLRKIGMKDSKKVNAIGLLLLFFCTDLTQGKAFRNLRQFTNTR